MFPGKKMTGHMGDETVTTQNLDVVRASTKPAAAAGQGAVPGPEERLRRRPSAVKANGRRRAQ